MLRGLGQVGCIDVLVAREEFACLTTALVTSLEYPRCNVTFTTSRHRTRRGLLQPYRTPPYEMCYVTILAIYAHGPCTCGLRILWSAYLLAQKCYLVQS
ncbi:hypothetical protein LSAT2_004151 [Lamellibrachia satsuma]|nr:hypothetical protein LSAT2_004151 [Lamellibrachia satsuma]